MKFKGMKNPFVDESALEEKPIEKSDFEKMMEQAERHTEIVKVETYMVRGLVYGMLSGVVAGFIMDNMSLCIGLGMLVGMGVGICFHKKPKSE